MKKILNGLANIGLSTKMSTGQKGLLQLSNRIAWFISLLCTFLGILGILDSEYLIAISDFILVIMISIPIVLNYYKRHTAAKLMLIFSLIVWIIAGAMFYSYDSVFKYVMILPISLTFIFFSEDSKWKLYFPIIFIMLSLVFFEIDKFYNHNYIDKNYNNLFSDEKFTGHVFESVTFICLIIIFIMTQSHFRSLLKKKESELMIFKNIFDNSHEGLAIFDINGRYVKQNNAHKEILEFADEELVSKTPAIHIGEKLFSEIVETLKKTRDYRG